MRLELQLSNAMIIQNSIFIGEVFQIEVSNGLVYQLRSCQNINLYPDRMFSYRDTSFEEFACVSILY